jgi:hypothetical protein
MSKHLQSATVADRRALHGHDGSKYRSLSNVGLGNRSPIVHLVQSRAVRVGALVNTQTPLRHASATPPCQDDYLRAVP